MNEAIAADTPLLDPVTQKPLVCPCCMKIISRWDQVIDCPGCHAKLHEECYVVNNGCTTPGCRYHEIVPELRVPELHCPTCDAIIPSDQPFCPKCGAPRLEALLQACYRFNSQFGSKDL